MQGRSILDSMFPRNLLKFLSLFAGLAVKLMEVQSEDIPIKTWKKFCHNSSLEGFRLNAAVLDVRDVSSRIDCIDECFVDSCCRAVNFRYSMLEDEPYKCEFLHDLADNTSSVLKKNNSYDYVFFIEPDKKYNSSCLHREIVDNDKIFNQSCKDIFEINSSSSDGVYVLQLNETSTPYRVYCHMSNLSSQCTGGGWTLVMKVNGSKETFKYDSDLWKNNKTFDVEAGLEGLTQNETKLASYNNTPFTKICLGMMVLNDDNERTIELNYTASSLYSVIADGTVYRETNLGRAQWESLMNDSHLQHHCGLQGFNIDTSNSFKVRIGIVGNNENHCNSSDTSIGFGIQKWGNKLSCGYIHTHKNITLQAFGYVFVQ